MSLPHLPAAAAVALREGFALATPATSHLSVQSAAGFGDLSAGRLGAIVAALAGLTGVVVGGMVLARRAGRLGASNGRLGAGVALVAGLIGVGLGGVVVATSDGGIGTGNGLGGAIVALVVGLIATVLGGVGLARARRAD
ncbi:DUF6223 family protein [Nocardia sp. bgisy134]|uniref:DUF6223 family protein n=1 Tax=unclassified Nocardia TaxID=2637762 RepID=UPI003D708EBE